MAKSFYELLNQITINLLFILLIAVSCNPSQAIDKKNDAREKVIIEQFDALIKSGEYKRAEKILRTFRHKYTGSAYSDDAAYRAAYLHVISDENNPFFDYWQANQKFITFPKHFPKSDYVYACNTWLKILNLYFESLENSKDLKTKNQQLKKQLDQLVKKNKQLSQTLRGLEDALQR